MKMTTCCTSAIVPVEPRIADRLSARIATNPPVVLKILIRNIDGRLRLWASSSLHTTYKPTNKFNYGTMQPCNNLAPNNYANPSRHHHYLGPGFKGALRRFGRPGVEGSGGNLRLESPGGRACAGRPAGDSTGHSRAHWQGLPACSDNGWDRCGSAGCHPGSGARDRVARTARFWGSHAPGIHEAHQERHSLPEPGRGGGQIPGHLSAWQTERRAGVPEFCRRGHPTLYRGAAGSPHELLARARQRPGQGPAFPPKPALLQSGASGGNRKRHRLNSLAMDHVQDPDYRAVLCVSVGADIHGKVGVGSEPVGQIISQVLRRDLGRFEVNLARSTDPDIDEVGFEIPRRRFGGGQIHLARLEPDHVQAGQHKRGQEEEHDVDQWNDFDAGLFFQQWRAYSHTASFTESISRPGPPAKSQTTRSGFPRCGPGPGPQ